jgi:hypothetical protein
MCECGAGSTIKSKEKGARSRPNSLILGFR